MKLKEMTSAQMRRTASELEVSLAANHDTMTPEQRKADRKMIAHLNYQADFKDSGGLNRAQQKAKAAGLPIPERKVKAVKAVKARKGSKAAKAKETTTSDPRQGLLPGFTSIVTPRVDELARDLVFQALQNAVNQEIQNVVELFRKKA